MKATELKRWMEQTGMTAVDIGSALKLDPDTVKRFLKTDRAHRSTIAAYARLMAEKPLISTIKVAAN
jgi:hypothetical protein